MNTHIKQLYNDLIKNLPQREKHTEITGFCGLEGKSYSSNRELMVIGRAVNGWHKGIKLSECSEERFSEHFEVKKSSSQMAWLDKAWLRRGHDDKNQDKERGYNARRSAFWRVNQKVLTKLGITDAKDWYHHLYWTNLYKVAPHSGGNPSNALIRAQQAVCNDILKEEIRSQEPRRILMLTSKSWANLFIENNVVASEHKPLLKYIDFVGYWKSGDESIPLVIAEHPQGRKEELLASNVCSALNSLIANQ
ncbi:hypothetical protein [Kangiella marina]|uniref:Uncharacterized protein n=1 Tax=Kangiella marina TaxID=1079178 RepID=A0ABP8IDZ6_9GAMM